MIVLGWDIGQAHDPSALVGLTYAAGVWTVSGVRTLPLGESYAAQVDTVADIVADIRRRYPGVSVVLAADRTGHRHTVDAALDRVLGVGVTITSGRRPSGSWPYWNVPKGLLVHAVEQALFAEELRLPPSREAPTLHHELRSLVRKPGGRIEASGSGHDDHALALMLAVYAGQMLAHPDRWARLEVRPGGAITPS